MVRGRGYVKNIHDIEEIVLRADGGTPVRIKDVATVTLGPEMRRGIADYNGKGDAVGGIVVMRQGENALNVIERVKAKLAELKPSLPAGVEIVTTYDRSELIEHAIGTVQHKLLEEIVVVSIIILLFLWHFPSSIVPIVTIPVSVMLAFIPMKAMGLNANLMSLAGIAISIGVLVDGAIVEVENAYNKIHHCHQEREKGRFSPGTPGSTDGGRARSLLLAARDRGRVHAGLHADRPGGAVVSTARVFEESGHGDRGVAGDHARSGHAHAVRAHRTVHVPATLSGLALHPGLRRQVLLGGTPSDQPPTALPVRTAVPFRVASRKAHDRVRVLVVATTVPVFLQLGSEFMPPLREGTILYMPSAVEPGMSVAEAQKALQVQDKLLMLFPEVDRVFGKAGRANTSTDPAPFTMMETTILLKPEAQWREKPRWYSSWAPPWLKSVLRNVWSDHISQDELEEEMNRTLQLPGISNAWTMPIKGRLDMLSTGIRTPVGIKIMGADLATIERIAKETEAAVAKVPGTRSAYAERVAGGYFSDFVLKRDKLARYGLSIDDANMMVMTAVGGDNQSMTIEGRERYGINVRYARDLSRGSGTLSSGCSCHFRTGADRSRCKPSRTSASRMARR